MDDDKRRELDIRRKALHQRREHDYSTRGPIAAGLRERGIPFEAGGGIWIPDYLPIASSRIDWQRVSSPAEVRHCPEPADRPAAVRELLAMLGKLPERLTFAYDASYPTISVECAEALSNLDLLLDEAWPVYVSSRPAEWLIECGRYGYATLFTSPPVDPAEQARDDARLRAYVAPLWRALAKSDRRLELHARDSAQAPDPKMPVALPHWKKREKSLKALVNRGDWAALEAEIRPWLASRAPGATPLALCLRLNDTPRVTIEADALVDHMGAVMQLTERRDEDASVGYLRTEEILLFDPRARWRLKLYPTGPYWRAEGTD